MDRYHWVAGRREVASYNRHTHKQGGDDVAGRIHMMIDDLIAARSGGNSTIAAGVRVKLLLRGIDPDEFNNLSPDDAAVIAKLEAMSAEFSMSGGPR